MKKILFALLLLAIVQSATNAVAQTFVSAKDTCIRYIGRTTLSNGRCLKYTYPGVQIRTNFEGTSLKMKMKPKSGYYMAEIDGGEAFKVHCPETDSIMTVVTGLAAGQHSAIITFANEGLVFKPEFYGFLLDKDCHLTSAPQLPVRKIEFIGNSITCGFGIEGANAKEKFSYATENQYYTYEAITSRNLNAQCFVVSRSGIGVYRNCTGNIKGDKGVMPDVYPYTLFGQSGEKWDFRRYTPDVVCINLGTNDTTSPGYDTTLLYNGYMRFYTDIRSHYPKAKIVFLSGTMIKTGTKRLHDLTSTLDRVQQTCRERGDNEVYRLDFTPEDGSLGYGCLTHPSKLRHARMAEELTTYLHQITGWE